jgi:hypothetical protein
MTDRRGQDRKKYFDAREQQRDIARLRRGVFDLISAVRGLQGQVQELRKMLEKRVPADVVRLVMDPPDYSGYGVSPGKSSDWARDDEAFNEERISQGAREHG